MGGGGGLLVSAHLARRFFGRFGDESGEGATRRQDGKV